MKLKDEKRKRTTVRVAVRSIERMAGFTDAWQVLLACGHWLILESAGKPGIWAAVCDECTIRRANAVNALAREKSEGSAKT